ncbi:lipase 3 precursor [Byssothecium circinans]|uniref:Lipase 3 n=1 Tax=Byssothecium circinans TaxID=147558 RepID=A0A6A5TPR8_9PLEO|nr:lipase 3 precursor [Byssothecium circinans]
MLFSKSFPFWFCTSTTMAASPVIHSKAGTFHGRHLPEFNQDVYLGIKYAPKPVRFSPATLAEDAPGTNFTVAQYGVDCTGYGSDTNTLVAGGWTKLGEDCLHLNIVKPRTNETKLPVLLWIYGGGWQQGATSDPRYNMSYIVQQSALINKPIIGISINYRMAAFGFLNSREVAANGTQNLGLLDQRLAMQWVSRHISSFGGDPSKVTTWGESAGAYSVGDHINAYGGDNQGLFRAAILESGGAVGPPLNGTDWYQAMYNNLTASVGCADAEDSLQCLRNVPYETIAPYGNQGLEWFHTIDGSFITTYGQTSLTTGAFAKIPIILGTNTDEGFGVNGVNTDADAIEQLTHSKRWNLNTTVAERLLELYPNDPALGAPYGWGNRTWPQYGAQYKRYTSIATDLTMFAPRRLLAESMAKEVEGVYVYRWDAPKFNNTPATIGVNHFSEIPFVFGNTQQTITPLGNSTENLALSKLVMRMWVSFAWGLDPNGHGVSGIVSWPQYGKNVSNFVFRADESYVEPDDDRIKGVAHINSLVRCRKRQDSTKNNRPREDNYSTLSSGSN